MFKTEQVDVCKLLSDLQREFGANPSKAVKLNLNGLESCRVRANELLHDVYANLVSNAIKHTGDMADILIDLDIVSDNGGRVWVEDRVKGDHTKGARFVVMLPAVNG